MTRFIVLEIANCDLAAYAPEHNARDYEGIVVHRKFTCEHVTYYLLQASIFPETPPGELAPHATPSRLPTGTLVFTPTAP